MAPPVAKFRTSKNRPMEKQKLNLDHCPPKKNHSQNKDSSLGFSKTPFEKNNIPTQKTAQTTRRLDRIQMIFEASPFYPI